MAKKKKEPKVEKVFGDKTKQDDKPKVEENGVEENAEEVVSSGSDIDDFLGIVEEEPPKDDGLTDKQRVKLEKINNVRDKISKILKTSNVEIVDENFDDDYEYGSGEISSEQSQQDYDSLKAMFKGKDKSKDELTLTIDEFDYTYIGQYLEEYDLLRMKNIKKVKIIRKRSPKLKKFLIAACLILLVGAGAVLGFLFTRPQPVYLKNVSLNKFERDYYVHDTFEYSGLYFIAEYSDGSIQKIKLTSDYYNAERSTGIIDRTGENNEIISFKQAETVNLVFSYQGFDVKYVVNVEERVETGLHAVYTGLYNVGENRVVNEENILSLVLYDKENKPTVIDLSQVELYVGTDKYSYIDDVGFRITKGTDKNSEIRIVYGTFSVTLEYGKSYV